MGDRRDKSGGCLFFGKEKMVKELPVWLLDKLGKEELGFQDNDFDKYSMADKFSFTELSKFEKSFKNWL